MNSAYDQFMLSLDKVWALKSQKIDWLAMEQMQSDILHSDLTDSQKVDLLKQCLDAFTRRGHFL